MTTLEQIENRARKLTEDICRPARCRFFCDVGESHEFTIIYPTGCSIRATQPIINSLQQGSSGCEHYQDANKIPGVLTPSGQVVRS